jgi:Uma2 family endonuclease
VDLGYFKVNTKSVKQGADTYSPLSVEEYIQRDLKAACRHETESNKYIKWEPELIVEVVSPTTHITDTIDKYLAYTTRFRH